MSTELTHFPGRDLQPYAEPILTASLTEGTEYFSVQYSDEEMLIPIVETWIYAGKSLEESEIDLLYFQDVDSYRQGIRFGAPGAEDASFQVGREGGLKHMFSFEHALNELLRCSLRRKNVGL